MDNLQTLFNNLTELCNNNDKIGLFGTHRGAEYNNSDQRLLIIGRAVNGWGIDEHYLKDMSCIKNDGDKLFFEGNNTRYLLSKSSFWRTNHEIWKKLQNNVEILKIDRWVDHIAWSNLYKCAPKSSGNPSNKLCSIQADICRQYLLNEIELLKPTHILFVTGWEGWFSSDKEIYDFSRLFPNVVEYKGSYVCGIGTYSLKGTDIPIIVSNRPDSRKKGSKESDYIDEVISHFSQK